MTRTGRRIVLTRYPHIASKASVGVLVRQHLAGGSIQNLLARVLKRLETGDVLMVTRLDRLARSTRDLLNILYTLGERGVGFKSLADSWADTTTPHGRLLVTMLAGIAEFERDLIRARTGEGRTRAKARGVRFGRPPALSFHQRQEVIQRLVEGVTQADLARTYGVSQATISRLQPNPFGVANVGAPQRPNRHVGSAGRLCPVMSVI